jgi:hypothetical protein
LQAAKVASRMATASAAANWTKKELFFKNVSPVPDCNDN